MAENPDSFLYTTEHEWVDIRVDGTAVIGITAFAQEQLGDIVYLDLPSPGSTLTQFSKMGEIESVKSVSDLLSPIHGKVTEVNEATVKSPELVNEDPYATGWLLRAKLTDPDDASRLLSRSEYDTLIAGLDH